MVKPIFIFSLPRSGSTLLQRVLMSHPHIASVAEPWVILPQIYLLRNKGTLAEYSSLTAYRGITDFIENLPSKREDYRASLRSFILDLYGKQCKANEIYFLDKTPRYYLIIDEIVELFPEAKFIFLFRNPVHVYASLINTWGNNRFRKQFVNSNDVVMGAKLLSEGFLKHRSRSMCVNYEDFVSNTNSELNKISKYLEMEIDPISLIEFSKQDPKGNLGDPGAKQNQRITSEGLEKWKNTFNSFLRKRFAIALINKIDDKTLTTQNYDKQKIIKSIRDLDHKNNHKFLTDALDYYLGLMAKKWNLDLLFSKEFSWIKKRPLS